MYIYLACPYTSPEPSLQENRAILATKAAAILMTLGATVFSPITQGHQIVKYLDPILAVKHSFWMDQCVPMLAGADFIFVLCSEGWNESEGIEKETYMAYSLSIPVLFIKINKDNKNLKEALKLNYILRKDISRTSLDIATKKVIVSNYFQNRLKEENFYGNESRTL